MAARNHPEVPALRFTQIREYVENLDLHKGQPAVKRRAHEERVAGKIRVPRQVSVADVLVRPVTDTQRAGLNGLRVRGSVVQMGGANLNVPADSVHHQRQHARVIDQVEEGFVA